jgi:hypothetical protein
MGANSIRVVIAEDEVLIRAGLEAVLEDSDFEIVRIVGNARDHAGAGAGRQHAPACAGGACASLQPLILKIFFRAWEPAPMRPAGIFALFEILASFNDSAQKTEKWCVQR